MRFLSTKKEPARTKLVYEAMVETVRLSQEDKALLLPSGTQPVYQNRICWAHDRLKRAGLSESPRRGYWPLTPAGRDFVGSHPALTEEQVEGLAKAPPGSRASNDSDEQEGPEATQAVPTSQSPQERIDSGVEELRASVVRDLLEVIGRSTPDFFEQLVLDVLHAMGYGTSRQDLQRVGRSGDGGIDGIISLDRLGLEKVYVQAKKWQGQVGSPQIQGFMGAL